MKKKSNDLEQRADKRTATMRGQNFTRDFAPGRTSATGVSFTKLPPRIEAARRSRRLQKVCGVTGACLLLLSPLVAANIGSCGAWHRSNEDCPDLRCRAEAVFRVRKAEEPQPRKPLAEIGCAVPKAFRDVQPNVLTYPEGLERCRALWQRGERPLRILQVGDSHVAGGALPQALRKELQRTLGAPAPDSLGAEGAGVTLQYFAKNGATASHFISPDYAAKMADAQPDLVIVSLGTNEAHGMGYTEAPHTKTMTELLAQIRSACPDAEVVMTTPPGDYLTTRYVDYKRTSRSSRKRRVVRRASRPNPMTRRCAENILAFAGENGLAAYDLFGVCGGEKAAVRNWLAGHFMRPDRVHFTPRGYEVMGTMMAQAIALVLSTPPGGGSALRQ